MSFKPVIAPDGIYYASVNEAARARGVGRDRMRAWLLEERDGWRYAEVRQGETLRDRIYALVLERGSEGVTAAEIGGLLYGGQMTDAQRSTVGSSMSDMAKFRRLLKTGERRKSPYSQKPGEVYVAVVGRVDSPQPERPNRPKRSRVAPVERDYRILPESETPEDMKRVADSLRHGYAVVPLRGGRWLVDDVEVDERDVIALALGEVKLWELRG